MLYLLHSQLILVLTAFSLSNDGLANPTSSRLLDINDVTVYPVNTIESYGGLDMIAVNIVFSPEGTLAVNNYTLSGSTLAGKASLSWDLNILGANTYVDLEKSPDGKNYKMLYHLKSREMTGHGIFTEDIQTTSFYRLKIRGTGGKIKYSNVVKLEGRQQKLFVFPNPTGSNATIFVEGLADGVYSAILKDEGGRIYTCKFHVQGETGSMVPPLPSSYKGVIWIHFSDEKGKTYPGGKLLID